MKAIYKISVLLQVILFMNPSYANFYHNHAQGWHWYQDPEIPLAEKKEPQKPKTLELPKSLSPTELVKAYQKELENKLHKAWVNPSQKNIKSYQEMQKDLMQRSENFSKGWMQSVYMNPQLDHTLIAPVNQMARHVYLDQQKEKTQSVISNLSKDYGLFFFFSSQCAYCHKFAPIVLQFSNQHNWSVLAISADGGIVPGFSQIVLDNGLSKQWKVEVFPSVFAVNPTTGHVLPIAYGLTSLEEMENRIMSLMENSNQ